MPYHLGFLNKNLYRKYPLRATSQLMTTTGVELPLNLLSACRITSKIDVLNIYIYSIYVKDSFINVTIAHRRDDGTDLLLGYFEGNIDIDYKSLPLKGIVNYVSGYLIIGEKIALSNLQGMMNLDYDNGKLEDSTIVNIPIPLVSFIIDHDKMATGNITFTLDNISEVVGISTISLDVINKRLVQSNNDNFSARSNCATSVIEAINSVSPDSSGNIDVYGILPVKIDIIAGGIHISAPGVEFTDICTSINSIIPPYPEDNPQTYPDILTVEEPEWKQWPQFVEQFDKVKDE
jgi:hypothetical protein